MKKIIFIFLAAVCSTMMASAQTEVSRTHKPIEVKYRGEVNLGYAIGGHMKGENGLKAKSGLGRVFVETVHGVTISKYAFVGGGVGFQFYHGKMKEMYNGEKDDAKWNTLTIPLFVNLRGMYPVNDNLKPFINLALGGSIVACSGFNQKEGGNNGYGDYYEDYYGSSEKTKLHGGFYCDFGAGVQYKRWNFSIGLQHQDFVAKYTVKDYYGNETEKSKFGTNSFYVKLGVAF